MAYSARRNAPKPSSEISKESHVSAETALRELFDLLEDYAPSWYTEEHHNRAEAALLWSSEYHLRPVEAPPQTISIRTHHTSDRKRN